MREGEVVPRNGWVVAGEWPGVEVEEEWGKRGRSASPSYTQTAVSGRWLAARERVSERDAGRMSTARRRWPEEAFSRDRRLRESQAGSRGKAGVPPLGPGPGRAGWLAGRHDVRHDPVEGAGEAGCPQVPGRATNESRKGVSRSHWSAIPSLLSFPVSLLSYRTHLLRFEGCRWTTGCRGVSDGWRVEEPRGRGRCQAGLSRCQARGLKRLLACCASSEVDAVLDDRQATGTGPTTCFSPSRRRGGGTCTYGTALPRPATHLATITPCSFKSASLSLSLGTDPRHPLTSHSSALLVPLQQPHPLPPFASSWSTLSSSPVRSGLLCPTSTSRASF